MRAAIVRTPGHSSAIEIVELADPVAGSTEVVVKVAAASVNPVDLQTRSGIYHSLGWVQSSLIGLGWDVAGVVLQVGLGVHDVKVGQRVAALIGGVDRPYGAYAEQVAVPAADVAIVPDGLSLTEAATVPLNATTASQALDLLGPAEGRSLLVTGAAGSVGGYALQLGRTRGFSVSGLARSADEQFVAASGAAFFDSFPTDVLFDAVLDAAAIGDASLTHIADGGAYVGVIPIAVPESVRGITVQAVVATPDSSLLRDLLNAVACGELTSRVHTTMPLASAREAHDMQEHGGFRGRIVLLP